MGQSSDFVSLESKVPGLLNGFCSVDYSSQIRKPLPSVINDPQRSRSVYLLVVISSYVHLLNQINALLSKWRILRIENFSYGVISFFQ